ncbi:TetR/AcrR family transcriptional regulator [Actinomyces oricola]|uniref:TetR/AcrR family transcriptional regulator n=1 Tax=Actinomyces oricola TaxID=206043 RepID=UPI000FFF2BEE|nr:TetR/AcrR family transcriptional regulator [Actinomyces oricola]
MRASKRERIIEGALELAQHGGFDHLTFEALAEHVGLTRGGLVYHFATKQALLEGIAAALLERWRHEAEQALGGPLEEADRTERIRALVRSVISGEILPGELSFMLSGAPEATALAQAWDALCLEWVGDPADLTPMQRVAILAMDGWWANQASGAGSHNPQDEATRELIIALAAGDPR